MLLISCSNVPSIWLPLDGSRVLLISNELLNCTVLSHWYLGATGRVTSAKMVMAVFALASTPLPTWSGVTMFYTSHARIFSDLVQQHLWSLISSPNFLFLFFFFFHFEITLHLWKSFLSLFSAVVFVPSNCNNHHITRVILKDLQWNHNPLFGVILTVLKLILHVAAAVAVRV